MRMLTFTQASQLEEMVASRRGPAPLISGSRAAQARHRSFPDTGSPYETIVSILLSPSPGEVQGDAHRLSVFPWP